MKEFWESRYREEKYAYGIHPNVFFKQQLMKLQPGGRLLLPLEGEGRNAVFAAKLGWEVDAFDFSVAAKLKATELAENSGVRINYTVTSAEKFNPIKDHYDFIAMVYAHLPPGLRVEFHHRLVNALKPGGILMVEAFTPAQLNFSSGGPKNEAMLYTAEILRKDFGDLEINLLEETETRLEEGEYHDGAAAVVRLVGRKK